MFFKENFNVNVLNNIFICLFVHNSIFLFLLIKRFIKFFTTNEKIKYKFETREELLLAFNECRKDSSLVFIYFFINLFSLYYIYNPLSFFMDKPLIFSTAMFIFVINFFTDDLKFCSKHMNRVYHKINIYILLIIFNFMVLLYLSTNLILVYLIFECLSFIFLFMIIFNIHLYKSSIGEEKNIKEISSIIQQIISNFYVSIFMFIYIIYIIYMNFCYRLDIDYLFLTNRYQGKRGIKYLYEIDAYIFFIAFLFKLGFPPFVYFKYNIYNEMNFQDLNMYNIPFILFFLIFFTKTLFFLAILDNSERFNYLLFLIMFIITIFVLLHVNDFSTDKEIILFSSYILFSLYLICISVEGHSFYF